MSNLNHTPGPWSSFNDKNGFTIDFSDSKVYKVICQRNEMVNFKEQSANARLISCAPEMLDLSIQIYNYLDPEQSHNMINDEIFRERLGLIIEKATGLKIEEVLK